MSETATMSDAGMAFVRAESFDPLPPPLATSGVIGWLRQNLFSSTLNIALNSLTKPSAMEAFAVNPRKKPTV
jgi:hypothetical protein